MPEGLKRRRVGHAMNMDTEGVYGQAVMGEAFARHAAEVDADRPTWLDPYAAQGPEEFFPVAAEAFFVAPHGLALEFPEVYALMRDFFHQDPRLHAR